MIGKGQTINKYNSLSGPQTETGIVGKKFIGAQTERGSSGEDTDFQSRRTETLGGGSKSPEVLMFKLLKLNVFTYILTMHHLVDDIDRSEGC